MAGDPYPWISWNDCIGYMPWLMTPDYSNPLARTCPECGAVFSDHIIGGHRYHPVDRPSLWFWDVALDVQEGEA